MLKNLVGIVTGGASGLGKAAAAVLISQGCHITISDITASPGKQVAESLGPKANFAAVDVRSSEGIEIMLDTVMKRYNKIDFIVNCAGIACAHKIYNFNANRSHAVGRMEEVMDVNFKGTFNMIRLGVRYIGMNQPNEDGLRGTIINTAGIEAYEGQIGQSVISAASGAIVSSTLPLARDLSSQGIRVACIAVGLFDTPLVQQIPDKVSTHMVQACCGPKRLGKPEEFGRTVQFILENPYFNGSVIRLDAGIRLFLG